MHIISLWTRSNRPIFCFTIWFVSCLLCTLLYNKNSKDEFIIFKIYQTEYCDICILNPFILGVGPFGAGTSYSELHGESIKPENFGPLNLGYPGGLGSPAARVASLISLSNLEVPGRGTGGHPAPVPLPNLPQFPNLPNLPQLATYQYLLWQQTQRDIARNILQPSVSQQSVEYR